MSSTGKQPLVWVNASEVVRCAQLAVDNWRTKETEKREARILEWQSKKTGFFRKRFYTREEAIQLLEEDDYPEITPRWVTHTIWLGRAALLAAAEEARIQLSPEQVSWLWPQIDPSKP